MSRRNVVNKETFVFCTSQLPEDVRALESCPFRLNWEALAFFVFLDEGLDEGAIRDFVSKTRSAAKFLDFPALAAHVDPESDLGKEISQAEQEHASSEAGGEFRIPAKLRARILEVAFQKEKRYAWKTEYLRRRVQLEAAEEKAKECENEVEKKKAEVTEKQSLVTSEENVATDKAAQEDRQNTEAKTEPNAEGEENLAAFQPEKTEEAVALEKAMSEHDAAVEALNVAKTAALKAVGRNVASFSVQQVYWIGGCCESIDIAEGMATAGLPLRGALCLRDVPKPVEDGEGALLER
ncbi:hypothetical protein BSKO_01857 [Bryopsis sp. KO-2023]|nr:hypothetical protein BSKO_01857 [Bryopsis sp. KO-2023]